MTSRYYVYDFYDCFGDSIYPDETRISQIIAHKKTRVPSEKRGFFWRKYTPPLFYVYFIILHFISLIIMDPFTIGLFVILLFFSAFFSGSEIALMSLPSHSIDAYVRKKKL